MPELVQVRKKAQVTLPLSVRKALRIEEGDFLDVRVQDGEIVLRAKKLVDKGQDGFWSRRWQEGERQAQEDIHAGRVHKFASATGAAAFLHKQAQKRHGAIRRA
ncbi:MAG: AbrB/MazE/SpoVT family DNA-binding domain-containing protein [Dehalococcoidia bacterium]|nr:AbrB/MazE/SpoVT family DNA-binding domain-containing protein [Dehalococcoidia bacterium]